MNPWWMLGGGHGMSYQFFRAPTGRNALKQLRHLLMVQFHDSGVSWRGAAFSVRDMNLHVVEGPLTPREAYDLDLGWSLAENAADARGGGPWIPTSPISREEAVRRLGEDTVRRFEMLLRRKYDL